jgi:hypothetical protein
VDASRQVETFLFGTGEEAVSLGAADLVAYLAG